MRKRYNLTVGVRELFFFYQLSKSRSQGFYHLVARRDTPEMFVCIPDSQKGMMDAYIVVTAGPILPPGYEDFQFPRVSTMSKLPKVTLNQAIAR
jgi:hypothetical protein